MSATDLGAGSGPCLDVRDGPLAGQEISLSGQLDIGRGFPEPGALGGDSRLSRRHARIARGPGGVYFLQDTGSVGGTTLNGERLRHAHAIKDGDEIRVGASTLVAEGLPAIPPAAQASQDVQAQARPHGAFVPRGAAHSRLGSRRLVSMFAGFFVAAMILFGALGALVKPPGSRPCPSGSVCHKPSTAPALQSLRTFHGSLGWHVEYDPGSLTIASGSAPSNTLVLHESDQQDGDWGLAAGSDVIGIEVRAYPAASTSAPAAMHAMAGSLARHLIGAAPAPSSDQMFAVPALGFHPGVGEVLEGNEQTPQGPGGLVKVAALSATAGRLTIAAGVVYSVQRASSQQNNPDRPLDALGDQVIETARFPSDGAR